MTYELVKEFFACEYFGKLPVKYKDDLQMYIVNGLKPELSVNSKGILPDESFRIKLDKSNALEAACNETY